MLLVAAVALVAAACSAEARSQMGTDAHTQTGVTVPANGACDGSVEPVMLTETVYSAAFTGIVERSYEGNFDPPRRPNTTWLVKVTGVDFQADVVQPPGGLELPLTRIQRGDEIAVFFKREAPVVGGEYYVLASQTYTRPEPGWNAVAAFSLPDMRPLVPVCPPLETLLGSGESGTQAIRKDLNVLAEEVLDRFDGRHAEDGPVLRRAREAAGFGSGLPPVDPLQGFLDTPAERRQLVLPEDLPKGAMEALDLVEFRALVILPQGFADDHWAVGFRTQAGFVGPFILEGEQPFVDMNAVRPRQGMLEFVVWASEPATEDRLPAEARVVGVPRLGAVVPKLEQGEVLVIDLGENTAKVVSDAAADGMIMSLLK